MPDRSDMLVNLLIDLDRLRVQGDQLAAAAAQSSAAVEHLAELETARSEAISVVFADIRRRLEALEAGTDAHNQETP